MQSTRVWAVNLVVDRSIRLPSGESLDRETFFEWLWNELGEHGLTGITEGSLEVGEAAASGLTPSARVLDAALPPPDRDWVGGLPRLSVTCWCVDEASARAAGLRLEGSGGCRVAGIRSEIWSGDDDWKQTFPPIDVAGFGLIRPAWEPGLAEAGADATTIFIDPGAGFGTGLHETTQLCLRALAAWIREGGGIERVLDFGSGSGILGIAAAVRGAAVVHSIEIDPLVHDAIRANADRNGVADRIVTAREIPADGASYRLVFANIVAPVLLEAADTLASRLCRGTGISSPGCLVLSGLLAEDLADVRDRYSVAVGCDPIQTTLGDWHCLRFVTG